MICRFHIFISSFSPSFTSVNSSIIWKWEQDWIQHYYTNAWIECIYQYCISMKHQSIQKRFYSVVAHALLEVPCEPTLVLLFFFFSSFFFGGGYCVVMGLECLPGRPGQYKTNLIPWAISLYETNLTFQKPGEQSLHVMSQTHKLCCNLFQYQTSSFSLKQILLV